MTEGREEAAVTLHADRIAAPVVLTTTTLEGKSIPPFATVTLEGALYLRIPGWAAPARGTDQKVELFLRPEVIFDLAAQLGEARRTISPSWPKRAPLSPTRDSDGDDGAEGHADGIDAEREAAEPCDKCEDGIRTVDVGGGSVREYLCECQPLPEESR